MRERMGGICKRELGVHQRFGRGNMYRNARWNLHPACDPMYVVLGQGRWTKRREPADSAGKYMLHPGTGMHYAPCAIVHVYATSPCH